MLLQKVVELYHLYNTDIAFNDKKYQMRYEPAESNYVKLMGGNSNWRGPVWMPINYMLIESLRKFHQYLGDDLKNRRVAKKII